MNPKAYRLPTYALPRRYDIELEARLDREDFHGKVTIQLDIKDSKTSIELHAKTLKLLDATLTAGGKALKGSITQDAEREMAAMDFGEAIPVGAATLEIDFDGEVNDGLDGLYLSKDGPEVCLATQCEETAARKIIPCFDEPTFKAHFAWKVTTAAEHTVLANGPLVSVEDSVDGQSKTWTFAPSKTMSSYLIALVIGNLAATPEETSRGVPLRVYALKGKEQMGDFAQDCMQKFMPYYEDYFGVPYHFDKYDQAAVPGFAAGAMENAGLVLFRQSRLLLNPATASWDTEKSIAHVIAHEFAHMWFGDYVTMKWWDDLWLNESFAEWFSYKALNDIWPEYHIWDDYQAGRTSAMSLDALEGTHSIYNKVETPADASEMFDVITYQKGCGVMRMLETFLGSEAFRAGIRTYMKEFAESNAAGGDLWRHLEQSANRPVSQIMESWLLQGGFPIIGVKLDGNKLALSQSRFFSNANAPQDNNQLWQTPLIIRYEDEAGVHTLNHLLTEKSARVELPAQGKIAWCLANADEIGFYRQNLDDALLDSLLANLNKLTPSEQMGLLTDQWALVRNGTHKVDCFLRVAEALTKADNYNVVGRTVGYLHNIRDLLEGAGDEAALSNFRAWIEQHYRGKLAALGYEPKQGESRDDSQSRAPVIAAMTLLAHNDEAEQQSKQWVDREAANPASVDPNLAGTFIAATADVGDAARFNRYVDIYVQRKNAGASPQERDRYMNNLLLFREPALVERLLGLMSDQTIPLEMVSLILGTMMGQRYSQVQAWEWTKAHWPYILKQGTFGVPRAVSATGNLPISMRADVVDFFDKNLNGTAEQSYARALETMDQLAEFRERTTGDVVAWFKREF